MQTPFQITAYRMLADFAATLQLLPYPILESGNGTQYKNYLQKTAFTVYHARLDTQNHGRVEVAIGTDNIADEINAASDDVYAWYLEAATRKFRPADKKSPLYWPRISLWSVDEVQLFGLEFQKLLQGFLIPSLTRPPIEPAARPDPDKGLVVDERVMREILTRRGQENFRQSLLRAYEGCCAISGCKDMEVLEAAHITAHVETQDYRTTNGLLLRADLHTLFDLLLLSIDPQLARVVVSRRLSETYQAFSGRTLCLPERDADHPDAHGLMRHFVAWQANEKRDG